VSLSSSEVVFADSIGEVPEHEVERLLSLPGYEIYQKPNTPIIDLNPVLSDTVLAVSISPELKEITPPQKTKRTTRRK
jgi:hypothetical protein